jgi:hypothetical protein
MTLAFLLGMLAGMGLGAFIASIVVANNYKHFIE